VLDSIQEGAITEGHGRALLALVELPEQLITLWERTVAHALTVRDVEGLAKTILDPPAPRAPAPLPIPPDPNLLDVQERIQNALATKVILRPNAAGGGKIELAYSDNEELQRLVELFSFLY